MTQLKFTNMEDVLKEINTTYISFSKKEESRNNKILASALKIVDYMKSEDSLFNVIYKKDIFYGGSYYDELRIGKPDEFDIDLLFEVKELAIVNIVTSNIPGFINLKVQFNEESRYQKELQKLKTFVDRDNYLLTEKILTWMHSVTQRAINAFSRNGNNFLQIDLSVFQVTYRTGGPAITLHIINTDDEDDTIDIDLVPCFLFGKDKWPKDGFVQNPVPDKDKFFAVPKAPKNSHFNCLERYWRLSFQAQERELIKNQQLLKSTVRLLKLLRDTYHDEFIASYYIKTIILHIVQKNPSMFWGTSLSVVFVQVLKEYKRCIDEGKIPYYWHRKYNFIKTMNPDTVTNIGNRLGKMIKDIDNNPDKPELIAKHLLGTKRYNEFIQNNQVVDEYRHSLQPAEEPSMNWIREPTVITNEENRSTAQTVGLVAGIIGGVAVAVAVFSAFKLFSDSRAKRRNSD